MISKRKSFRMFAASLVAVFFVGALPWRELKADANTHGEYELSPLSVVYDQTSSWGTTTQGEFVITNSSEETVESWTLEIEYAADLQISNLWNGQDLRNETTPANVLVIGNEVYNASIAPGATVSFGLIVTGTEYTPVAPVSVSIYSEDEQIEVVEPSEETTEETEVTESEVTPTVTPTVTPSVTPTTAPTEEPTATPTVTPTTEPTATPTPEEEEPVEEPEGTEEEIDPALDSDGDEIPDVYEIEIGTNPNDPDSDGDGLEDYLEVIIEYDPRLVDSDDDGILDGNEDLDNDGISNINEMLIGTRLFMEDSDQDGLLDGEEVDVYGTDPLNPDSDGDGIRDGDEVAIGKDPLNAADGNIRIEQSNTTTISNSDDPAITSVDVTTELTGSIDSSFSVIDAYNVDIYSTDVTGRIGSPIIIDSTESFESAEVTIHYSESELGDVAETDLEVLWYDEETGFYVEQDQAILDSSNNAISLEISSLGSYVLVSRTQWHGVTAPTYTEDDIFEVVAHEINEDTRYNFYIFMERDLSPEAERNIYNLYSELIEHMRDGDTVSIISQGSMSSFLPNQYYMRNYTSWVSYWLQTRTGTQATEVRGAIAGYESYVRSNVARRSRLYNGNVPVLFLIQNCSDQECLDYYDQERVSNEYEICYIAPSEEYAASSSRVNGCRYTCYSDTPDIWGWYFGDQDPYYAESSNYYWESLDRDNDGLPDVLEEDGMLGTNGNVYYSDPDAADTDGDGISDRDEMGEMYTIRRHADEYVDINGVVYPMSMLDNYGFSFLEQFIPETVGEYSYVFDVKSDPSVPDSDGDSILDSVEVKAFQRDEEMSYILFTDQSLSTWAKVNAYIQAYAVAVTPCRWYHIDSSETFRDFIETMARKRDSDKVGLTFNKDDLTTYQTYSGVKNLVIIGDANAAWIFFNGDTDQFMTIAEIDDMMNTTPGIPCDIQNIDLQMNNLAEPCCAYNPGLEDYTGIATAEMFFCYNGEHVVHNVYAWYGNLTFITLDNFFRVNMSSQLVNGDHDDGYYHFSWNDGTVSSEYVGRSDYVDAFY